MPSDVKEAPSTQRCEVCGERYCWLLQNGGRARASDCYERGFKRFRAENASLRERISFLEKQLAERKGP